MELDASPIVNPVPQRLCSKIGKTKGGRRLDRSSSSYHLIQCVQKRCGAREDGRKEGKRSTIFDRPLIRVCDDDDVSGGGDEDPISGSNLALSIKWKMADSTVGHPVVRAFV